MMGNSVEASIISQTQPVHLCLSAGSPWTVDGLSSQIQTANLSGHHKPHKSITLWNSLPIHMMMFFTTP